MARHTTRKTSKSALMEMSSRGSEYAEKQYIYIVKTGSGCGAGSREGLVKVPLVAENVVINEVNL
jgi:predicted nucleotide-binding protein (sugar kinase/HSP70/actin superfamily)